MLINYTLTQHNLKTPHGLIVIFITYTMINNSMQVKMRLDGNKIVATFDVGDEKMAEMVYQTIRTNPNMILNIHGYEKIVKGIKFKRDGTKIVQTIEFIDEETANCFYLLQKKLMR